MQLRMHHFIIRTLCDKDAVAIAYYKAMRSVSFLLRS